MKAFSVYYAIERKTGKYVCMGIGSRGELAELKSKMYSDISDSDVCAKYSSGAVYTDYGMVAIRSFPMPKVEPKKASPKKTKKVSEE